MKKTTETAAPKKKAAAPKKSAAPKGKTETRAEAMKRILKNVEKKMAGKDLRATLGDYIRLVQLSKEMLEEPKTEIKVTWVEAEPESSPEK